MKRLGALVAFLLVTVGRAFGADLPSTNLPPPVLAPPPPVRTPATYIPSNAPVLYNWGGLYFGINGGYGFGSGSFGGSTWAFPAGTTSIPGCTTGCNTGAFSTDGGIVGSTFGANFQAGPFVLGIEGDIDWSNISGSASGTVCTGCKTTNDWLGTARLRSGFTLDRVLFFATGGAAFGDIKASLPASLGGGSNDSTVFGWTAGAGVEVAWAQNWTSKIEYLYVDLSNGSGPTASFSPPGPVAAAVSFSTNLIRGGLNYKFDF
jgi:outer membrane immunogenic protein